MKQSVIAFAWLLLVFTPPLRAAEPDLITQDELVRRTQELCDAVVPGNAAPWKKYYADDCLYHDEKGRALNKPQLVADIAPLPEGYSGKITIDKPESRITSGTAVLSYDMLETETIFGQELHARYHQIDTWMKRAGQWQIVASQAFRYYEDPAEGKAEPAELAAYLGTYELSPKSERKSILTSENGKLFLQRTGGKKVELVPEVSGLFFRRGVEGRILFRLGPDGKAAALIDRRNNEDVVWKKVG
jgi:hypothetical protein